MKKKFTFEDYRDAQDDVGSKNRGNVLELAVVLLVTGLAFMWGYLTARAERGGDGVGGEFLLLFLPTVYYIGKAMVRDWVTDLRRLWEESGHV